MWRAFFEALVIAVLCASFTRTFVVQAFKIPSASMEETLLAGDLVLVNKFIYAALRDGSDPPFFLPMRAPRRGEVVVFKHPPEPYRDFIKRCVALPGESIELRDRDLWIDRRRLDESRYAHYSGPAEERSAGGDSNPEPPFNVPPGHYYCLGDHRDNSSDSRDWGPVPAELIRGRALIIYWSFAESSHPASEWSIIEMFREEASRWRWRRCFRWVR